MLTAISGSASYRCPESRRGPVWLLAARVVLLAAKKAPVPLSARNPACEGRPALRPVAERATDRSPPSSISRDPSAGWRENGAGKSTLLRVLARRLRPASGTVATTARTSAARVSYFQPALRARLHAPLPWVQLQRSPVAGCGAHSCPWTNPFLPTLLRIDTLTRLSTATQAALLHALRAPTEVTILDEPTSTFRLAKQRSRDPRARIASVL